MANDNNNDDRLTGKQSYIVISDDDGDAAIPITSYLFTADRLMTPRMNSVHYNGEIGQFSTSQVAVAVATTVAVEGRFRLDKVPAAIIGRLYSDEDAVMIYLGLDAGNVLGHGRFDIRNFQCDVPIDDTVNFTCMLLGNGPFFPNE